MSLLTHVRFRALLSLTCFLFISSAFTQDIDANLKRAKTEISSIETQLKTLKTGDVAQYNRISEKLTNAATLLQSTTSTSHPDYVTSVRKWSGLRQNMVDISTEWQNSPPAGTTQQQQSSPAQSPSHQASSTNQAGGSAVNADAILGKYQRANRVQLSANPSPSEVEEWGNYMKALQTTELQKDLALLKSSDISQADAQRVSTWISGNFQNQISEDINAAMQRFNGTVTEAVQLSRQIENIGTDQNKIYNFAYGDNGQRNAARLEQGLLASVNGKTLDGLFPSISNPNRQEHLALIAFNQQTFAAYQEQAQQLHVQRANAPKKKPKTNSAFIKGINQTLWYRGSELASIDRKGSIWMNSTDVGDITSSGRIWVGSNDLGSIEKDGKVWFRGNHVGTLEESGAVWRNGTQVGLIEPDGTVWIDGNSNGTIEPFEGEWKRAAVIYFFQDLFHESNR